MKKRILTLIVCMALILGIVPFSLSANVALPDTVIGVGNKVVALEADVANDVLPTVFGTKEGDGIVWTNKNVAVKDG